ncbi:hypothetical protein CPC08DRAFT_713339 [Agrocybe pediades]|nr:hypothetical protein CPC08DRAFT_713339 [Agrocybe pediades]
MGTDILSQDEPHPRTGNVEKINNGATRRLPGLPVKLHKLIINELEGETKALKQCALTCKVYRHLAQKNLLKSVLLMSRNSAGAEEFVAFLKASPQIANCIERLVISGPETKLIAQVMRPLINIVDMVLRGCGSFARFEPASQLAVMLKCESLVSLTLQSIKDVPLKVFDHLQRLEHLTLDDVHFVDDPPIKEMKLGDTSIRHGGTVHSFLEDRGFGLGSLETLSIVMDSHSYLPLLQPDYEEMMSLIESCAESLKVLDVTISTDVPVSLPDDNEQRVFHVSTLPILK